MADGPAGDPILDPEKWRRGSDADRAAWTWAGRERLLDAMRQTVAICRRDYYDPADPNDWTVPNLERRLAGVELAFNAEPYDPDVADGRIADFLAAVPPEMHANRKETT